MGFSANREHGVSGMLYYEDILVLRVSSGYVFTSHWIFTCIECRRHGGVAVLTFALTISM